MARTTLRVVLLLVLIGTTFWILRPFLPAILWSAAIVVSTWPLLVGLERRLGGGRTLAAAVMTTLLTVLLLLPFFLGVVGIINNAERITEGVQSISKLTLPPPPAWIESLPLFGERIDSTWRQTAAEGGEGLLARVAPYAGRMVTWLLGQLGGVGKVVFHIVMTIVGVVFLYRHGESAGARIRRFAVRIAGGDGERAVELAAQATRSVAIGVLLTSMIQALLAALGLVVAGVPWVGILTLLMVVTGLAQVGPTPVLVPAVAWLYWQGAIGWGTALLAWTGFVTVIDNLIRPFLIRRGADLPLMLVFVGVIGGLVGFGVVGLFIGPVVLAVAYRLVEDWTARVRSQETAPAPVETPLA
ncbi:MAG TPA: AI-2E family transporter YdiK [Thermoanaerobaculia bacterium]|nr:AI-2E family transporter YdiK [Thermoanaerobaculia bacterium]